MRSTPSPSGYCNIKKAERERVQFGSVQFKVVTVRSEKAHMRSKPSPPGHFNIKEGERERVQFGSVQGGIYALGKSPYALHTVSQTFPPTLPLRQFQEWRDEGETFYNDSAYQIRGGPFDFIKRQD